MAFKGVAAANMATHDNISRFLLFMHYYFVITPQK